MIEATPVASVVVNYDDRFSLEETLSARASHKSDLLARSLVEDSAK